MQFAFCYLPYFPLLEISGFKIANYLLYNMAGNGECKVS